MAKYEGVRESDADTTPPPRSFAFDPNPRPTVPDINGKPVEMTDTEMRQREASLAHTDTVRKAVAAQRGTSTIDAALARRNREPKQPDPNQVYGFTLPLALDPQRVANLAGDETELGYVKEAVDFITNTHSVLTRIDEAYRLSMTDMTLTPDARTQRIEKEVTTAHDKAFAARGAALESLAKKIAHTETELNRPLEQAAATERSNELRSVLRGLSSEKVNKAISDALGASEPTPQQRELIQATLGAHALTVGITEEQQALHVRRYNEKTSPTLLRRLELLGKARDVVSSVHPDSLRSYFEGSMRSPFSRASNISGVSTKAQAALAAINAPKGN